MTEIHTFFLNLIAIKRGFLLEYDSGQYNFQPESIF
jgi:hypothetical protein